MVELVDDDVGEVVGREALQILRLAQCLDRREQHRGTRDLLETGELAHHAAGTDAAVGRECLVEDLFPVRNEQQPLRPEVDVRLASKGHRVERREPGLAEPGRQHDEPRAVAVGPRTPQCRESLELDRVRIRRRQLLRRDLDHSWPVLRFASQAVGANPLRSQRHRMRVHEQCVEGAGDRGKADGITARDDAVVPLDAIA